VIVTKNVPAEGEDPAAVNGTESTDARTKHLEELLKEPRKPVFCYVCGLDCARSYYHNARSSEKGVAKANYDLCPNCYIGGRYPRAHDTLDFVHIDDPGYSGVPDRDRPWSDEETLRLMEALEADDDSWDTVATHVGTRNREECVARFLGMGIEDPYVKESQEDIQVYGAMNYGRLPFHHMDNPVMAVAGYFATLADPGVTAAAADRSVDAMRQSLLKQLENGYPEPDAEATRDATPPTKTEDSMDVDAAASPRPAERDQAADPTSRQPASVPAVALAGAAARAGALVMHEEREVTRLVSAAVNVTLQKLELKLKQFSEMEAVLQAERLELERERRELFLDRLAFKKRVMEIQEGLRGVDINGQIGPGAKDRLGFVSLPERKDEDVRPLDASDEGYRTFQV
jgi:SWI/SNF related-matrix-associated actin-dependent regulator of chromatin subfamily C